MGELNFCLLNDILKNAREETILGLSLDRNLPYLVSRIFHNKFTGIFISSAHCYSHYIDPLQIFEICFVVTAIFTLLAIIIPGGRRLFWVIYFLTPLFFIINPFKYNLGVRIFLFQVYYNFFSIFGMYKVTHLIKMKIIKWYMHKKAPSKALEQHSASAQTAGA